MVLKDIEKDVDVLINLDNLLEILGNPTRRVILAKLAKVPHSASELAHSLGISRQAVHSQLKLLEKANIIENNNPESRGGRYRIKTNISLRVDITPDYYDMDFNLSESEERGEGFDLKELGCDVDYEKIKDANTKLKYIGNKIRDIEKQLHSLEGERSKLVENKECLILELKRIMTNKFDERLRNKRKNTEKELIYTMFYNPMTFFKRRINIDKLMDEMFFTDLDSIDRAQNKTIVHHLLRDLASMMDFFREDEEDWFFDI